MGPGGRVIAGALDLPERTRGPSLDGAQSPWTWQPHESTVGSGPKEALGASGYEIPIRLAVTFAVLALTAPATWADEHRPDLWSAPAVVKAVSGWQALGDEALTTSPASLIAYAPARGQFRVVTSTEEAGQPEVRVTEVAALTLLRWPSRKAQADHEVLVVEVDGMMSAFGGPTLERPVPGPGPRSTRTRGAVQQYRHRHRARTHRAPTAADRRARRRRLGRRHRRRQPPGLRDGKHR